jgi:signal transduction histidine kinase/ActR/RegA family two-component response regulator
MQRILTFTALCIGYIVAAKVGLSFASVNPSVSAIWPPTGIALAAFLTLGRGAAPAILTGAFLANVTTAGSVATSIGIAIGNTLEAWLGASLVNRFAHGRHAFNRPQDIFRFVLLGGLLSTMVSATIGVTTLSLAGNAPWSEYASIWITWWLGDASGALLVTPLLLVWKASPSLRWTRKKPLEAAFLLIVLIASAAFVFGGIFPLTRNYPLAFLCIPALVWTAFQFGQREAAFAIVILSGIATWGTLRGYGPFAITTQNESLLILQAFMGTVAVMAMAIASLVAGQRRIEEERMRLLAAERAARADAEAANVAKDTFLAMLGHELRNPLSTITMAVHVLDLTTSLKDKAARAKQIIASQVGHLARLVDDLLDVTRVTTGKIMLHRSRLELADVVARSLETLRAAGRTDQHRIEFSGQPAWVEADATRLEQVVANLITNAMKYTPPGGTIQVTVEPDREWAMLRVIDTGTGIAPDLLPRIFDLFTQGDRGADRAQGGLGIGLTLVKRLTELHDGTVEAASEGAGRGSVFTVRIPAASPRRVANQQVLATVSSRNRRVLVVEDQPDARESLVLALQLAGHDVFEAADGPSGIETATRVKPDVAIIDIGLPGCDGYEVARQVRRAPDGETTFLIALTGYGQPEDRRRAAEAGFDLHLTKPVAPDRLNALMAEGQQGKTPSQSHVSRRG